MSRFSRGSTEPCLEDTCWLIHYCITYVQYCQYSMRISTRARFLVFANLHQTPTYNMYIFCSYCMFVVWPSNNRGRINQGNVWLLHIFGFFFAVIWFSLMGQWMDDKMSAAENDNNFTLWSPMITWFAIIIHRIIQL